jgi:hypothetical protein
MVTRDLLTVLLPSAAVLLGGWLLYVWRFPGEFMHSRSEKDPRSITTTPQGVGMCLAVFFCISVHRQLNYDFVQYLARTAAPLTLMLLLPVAVRCLLYDLRAEGKKWLLCVIAALGIAYTLGAPLLWLTPSVQVERERAAVSHLQRQSSRSSGFSYEVYLTGTERRVLSVKKSQYDTLAQGQRVTVRTDTKFFGTKLWELEENDAENQ